MPALALFYMGRGTGFRAFSDLEEIFMEPNMPLEGGASLPQPLGPLNPGPGVFSLELWRYDR